MKLVPFFLYLLIMAGVTYLIRAVPFAACQGKIENRFMKSFLAYVPYAVLSAMTFPAIFYSTGNEISGIVATGVALVLAYRRKSLLFVAVAACLTALCISGICMLI